MYILKISVFSLALLTVYAQAQNYEGELSGVIEHKINHVTYKERQQQQQQQRPPHYRSLPSQKYKSRLNNQDEEPETTVQRPKYVQHNSNAISLLKSDSLVKSPNVEELSIQEVLHSKHQNHPLLTVAKIVPTSTGSYATIASPVSHEHHEHEEETKNYKFGYRVSDPHTHTEFGHSEVHDGHVARGFYHVLLPDGRLQNVKYWAGPSGYSAVISYDH